MTFEFVKNDLGYTSILSDIEKQMDLYRKEIDAIDKELKLVGDDEKKNALLKEKKHLAEKAG